MSIHSLLQRAGRGLVALPLGLCLGLLAMHTGCSKNDNSYEHPAPSVSSFQVSLTSSFPTDPTKRKTAENVPVGGSVWCLANFGTKDGSAVVTPGNYVVTSNVPFQIPNITGTTTYTLTVTSGDGKKATAAVTVSVLAVPSSLTYTNEDATYYAGVKIADNTVATVSGTTPMTYTINKALPNGLQLSAATGAITGTPSAQTPQDTYTVTAANSVGSTTRNIKITIADTPLTFTLNPTSIAPGASAILSWNADLVAGVFNHVSISAAPTDVTLPAIVGLSGTANVGPSATTIYTLSATPTNGGADVVRTLGLTVGNAPVSITSFDATPAITTYGGSSNLTWTYIGDPLSLTINGTSVLGLSNLQVNPVRRQTYVLTGENLLNSAPSSLSKKVAARGQDILAGAIGGAGMRDATGALAQFNNPQGMSFDTSGNLYIADYGNFTIRRVTPSGVVTTYAGQSGLKGLIDNADPLQATLNGPRAVDCDMFGNLVVSDGGAANTGKLRLIQPSGAVITVTGADAYVKQPWDFAIDFAASSATAIMGWVVDYTNRSVTKLSIDPATGVATVQPGMGTLGLTATPAWSTTSGLAVDDTGILYIADSGNQVVRAVKGTTVSILAGVAATTGTPAVTNPALACLNKPYGVAVSTSGGVTTVYIADKGNNAIRRLQVDNTLTPPVPVAGSTIDLVAGPTSGTVVGAADGPGASASFAGPQGIVLNNSKLYVTDSGNAVLTGYYSNTIRTLDTNVPATQVSTFLGTSVGATAGSADGLGAAASFKLPIGIARDSQGNLFVADSGNGSIRKIASDGSVSTTVAIGLTNPSYVAVDAFDNVIFVEKAATTTSSNLKYLRKSDNTVQTIVLSGGTLSQTCGALAVDASGNCYVADGGFIKQIPLATGVVTTSTFSSGTYIGGVVVDAAGVIYFADNSNAALKSAANMTTATASLLTIGGTSGTAGFDATHISKNIQGIVLGQDPVSTHAVLAFADNNNQAIRYVDLTATGTVNTLLGRGVGGFSTFFGTFPGLLNTGGNSLDGSIYKPVGLTFNMDGDLVVVTNNGLVQITAPFGQ
jgi:sugar lactone lactonase YvrE